MKNLIYILLFIPFLGFGQDIQTIRRSGVNNSYTQSKINETIIQTNKTVDSTAQQRTEINALGDSVITNLLKVEGTTLVVDDSKVGIGTASPANALDIVGSEVALVADIHNTLSTGISAWQVINDLNRRASFGIAGSANAIVTPHSLAIYQQGYGATYFIVDGNQPFIWSTDVGNIHLLQYTEKMRLSPGGMLSVDTIDTDSIAVNAITYKDTYWEDLRVPFTNTKLNPLQSEPEFEDTGDGIFTFAFDTGNDSTESLHFIAQIPHSYKEGTDLDIHIHWSPSTTNGDNVVWKVFYKAISINGTFGAVQSFRVIDAADGTAMKHQLTDLGDIDGSGLGISAMIIGNVTRLGDAAEDTFTGVAYGWELDFHYQIDAPGSEEETSKY